MSLTPARPRFGAREALASGCALLVAASCMSACDPPAAPPDAGATDDAGSDSGPDAGPPLAPTDLYLEFERIPLEDDPAQITDLAFLGETDELLLTTRDGWIHRYRLEGDAGTRLSSVLVPDVHVELDCGLVSIAPDPDFADNGFVFVGQCFSDTHSGIQRLELRPDHPEESSDSAVEILRYGHEDATHPWHNVGKIGFEPDGVLWALFGDKTVEEAAGDPSDPLGSLVRVVPSRAPGVGGYAPAPGNPHAEDEGFHPDVYATGLRSPWTAARDPSGRWVVADVGAGRVEELDLIDAPGLDFGWPRFEGPCRDDCGQSEPPLLYWGRSERHRYVEEDPLAESFWGRVGWVAPFYAPPSPELDRYEGRLTNRALFGGLCLGFLRMLELNAEGEVVVDAPVGHLTGATGWETGPDGYLYAARLGRCTINASAIFDEAGLFRAVPGAAPPPFEPPASMPDHLSDLGLFPRAPDLSVTPTAAREYEPRHPLWSNGLDKLRHVVLPDGSRPDLDTPGDEMPLGTLFFKTFFAEGRAIETRALRREEEGWTPSVYLWNEDNSDAERLDGAEPTEVTVELDGETVVHEIPSRGQCAACHEVGARTILGFTPAQVGEAEIEDDDEATEEVLGYVYGNCTHCHDGSGGPSASFSMLPADFLANVIDQPTEGSASGVGLRVVPGEPDQSVLLRTLTRADPLVEPMPPRGVQQVDDEAVELIREWIDEL